MTRIEHEFLLPTAFSIAMLTCISLNAAQMASQPWVTNRISEAINKFSQTGNVSSADYAQQAQQAQHAADADRLGGQTLPQVVGQAVSQAVDLAKPGNYAVVSNKAMTALQQHQSLAPATNYANYAIAQFSVTGHVSSASSAATAGTAAEAEKLTGGWTPDALLGSASNTAESVTAAAVSGKQDRLPYETNAIPYSVIDGVPDFSSKQDALPYPTNKIPYSAVDGTPDLSGYATRDQVYVAASAGTNYTDQAIAKLPSADFSTSNAQLVATIQATAPFPGDYATVSNRAMTALRQHQSLAPATNYADSVGSAVAQAATNYSDQVAGGKQDALPYPTNKIPYSAISGRPDLSGYATHDQVNDAATAGTNYTDTAIAQIPPADFSTGNAQLVATIEAAAPFPGDYATVSNKAMTALQAHQSLAPATNYADSVASSVARAATNHTDIAVSSKQDTLPFLTNAIPWSVLSGIPDFSWKQDTLPYPTNKIPYAAILGVPDLSGFATKTEVSEAAEQGTNYVDKIAGEFQDGTREVQSARTATTATTATTAENASHATTADSATTATTADSATTAATATSASTADKLTGGWTAETILSSASNTAESVAGAAAGSKQDKLPYLTNAIPYSAIADKPDLSLKQDVLPYPTSAIPYSVIADAPEGMTTNNVKDIVTNTVVVGYSDWTYTGDTSESQSYSITQAQSGDNYVFTLWDTKTSAALGTATTSELNPLSLSFSVTGGTIVATRSPLIRNALGLARYADVQALDDKIENMDTSYYRVVGITNKNQSVQYVETDANTTSLQIQMPESGMTKDWLVYIKALTNLTLVLPPADYWVVNETVTNEIPPLVPTALYFSQIADNTYSIARQELVPITVLSQRQIENNLIRAKMRKARRLSK